MTNIFPADMLWRVTESRQLLVHNIARKVASLIALIARLAGVCHLLDVAVQLLHVISQTGP